MELKYVVVQYDRDGYCMDVVKLKDPEVAIDVAQQYADGNSYSGLKFKVEVRYA